MSNIELKESDIIENKCVICGEGKYIIPAETLHWKHININYVYCACCGNKYMHRSPSEKWYRKYYKDEFWQSKLEINSDNNLDSEAIKKLIALQKKRAHTLFKLTLKIRRPKKGQNLLDIGASMGGVSSYFREKTGVQCYAIEPNELARNVLYEIMGHKIIGYTYEDIPKLSNYHGKFDYIIIKHSLENTANPLAALRNVRSLLNDKGILIFEGMNLYYFNLTNPYHPNIFSPEVFNILFSRAGYRILLSFGSKHPAKRVFVNPVHARYWRLICEKEEATDEMPPVIDPLDIMHYQKVGEKILERSMIVSNILRKLFSFRHILKTHQSRWDRDWNVWEFKRYMPITLKKEGDD